MTSYVCAVDVGTRSARAGLFAADGRILGREVAPFDVYEDQDNIAEYASQEIWDAVCRAVRQVLATAALPPRAVAALAFDATCSLVLRDADGNGLPLGPNGRDTIAWFDHRAVAQARACSDTGHAMIGHLGGAMSPEMQTPKLMWLKQHRPDIWANLAQARDLTDDLTARATGTASCSLGTLSAKWAFLPRSGGWQRDFLETLGLGDLLVRGNLPDMPVAVGDVIGTLTMHAAEDLGLLPGTPVGAGLIDAYAGALGALDTTDWPETDSKLTLITGTSSCVLAMSRHAHGAPGIWGPFFGAVLPDQYCCEGGLSAAGALLDHVIASWPGRSGANLPDHAQVNGRVAELIDRHGPSFADDLNILPDFNGNRTPFADPSLTGTMVGMTLDRSFDGLCRVYWRAAVALALSTRQIVAHMAEAGVAAQDLTVTGGFSRSKLLMQMHADAIGVPVRKPLSTDGVLLGTAMVASVAAGQHATLAAAVAAMSPEATLFTPSPQASTYFDRQFQIFQLLQAQRAELTLLRQRLATD